MRLETNFVLVVREPHNGLGAPQARPPARSGDRGAPASDGVGGPRGRSPPDLEREVNEMTHVAVDDVVLAYTLTRRQLLRGLAVVTTPAVLGARARAQSTPTPSIGPLSQAVLPQGVRSRVVSDVNGIRMHVLEAGFGSERRPAVLLVHGFPELAYSWRKVMPAIAAAGYHVIAPDLRGYGRTSGTDVKFDDDLSPWRTLNEVTDMVALVSAFGYRSISAIVGHDFGSPVAAWCAVVRPDIFRSVVLMSAPFGGTPSLPFDTADAAQASTARNATSDRIYDDLAKLTPPR